MKAKYLFIFLFFFGSLACHKDENSRDNPSQNDGNDSAPVHVEEALFTRPSYINLKKSDTRIMDSLVHYLDCTPKGAVVYINIYLFGYEPVLEAVKDAYERGVKMHIMIDYSRSGSIEHNKTTIPQLQYLIKNPSTVVVVNSDVTSASIDHEKYALFSRVNLQRGVAKNLVFATSHNFTYWGTRRIQDAVVMTNKALYDAFLINWQNIASMSQSGMTNFKYSVTNVGDSIKAIFFPSRKDGKWDGNDPILQILSKFSEYDRDTVCVFMASWTRIQVAEKLTTLQNKGVNVQVIVQTGGASKEVLSQLSELMGSEADGYLKVLDPSEKSDHSKVMLIKGIWNGKKQKIILMGSHNYTYNALKYNNEFILMLKDSKLFDKYWNYFFKLKKEL